jgi:hypothetical protein
MDTNSSTTEIPYIAKVLMVSIHIEVPCILKNVEHWDSRRFHQTRVSMTPEES